MRVRDMSMGGYTRVLLACAMLLGAALPHAHGHETTGGTEESCHGGGSCPAPSPDKFLLGVVEAWASHQGDAARPWLVARPQYGLGNRILSVVSSLALAIASGRRLAVDWGEHFLPLFEAPLAWGVPPEGELRGAAMLILSALSPSFPEMAADLACNKWLGPGGVLEGSRGVEVVSDQFFMPLVLMSEAGEAALCPEGVCRAGWADEVFRVLGSWLIRPSRSVRDAVMGWEAHWGAAGVGVHVRSVMYEWEQSQVPMVESDVALKCTRNLARNVSDPAARAFVAATSDEVRAEAGRVLGGGAAWTQGATERLMVNGEGEAQAMMDLVLLSRCHLGIVTSVHSTFGYVAHGLSGVVPWVVTSATPKGFASKGGMGRSKCVRATGYGPCFHGWDAVRDAVGECYQEARHVAYLTRKCWY